MEGRFEGTLYGFLIRPYPNGDHTMLESGLMTVMKSGYTDDDTGTYHPMVLLTPIEYARITPILPEFN